MIHSLYDLTRKGLFQVLSFILAAGLFVTILCNSQHFTQLFGIYSLITFYGMTILWIHGVGLDIRSVFWRAMFLPLTGYAITLLSLLLIFIY